MVCNFVQRADAVAATVRAAERELRAALADAAEEAARASRQATRAWDAEKAELQQQYAHPHVSTLVEKSSNNKFNLQDQR